MPTSIVHVYVQQGEVMHYLRRAKFLSPVLVVILLLVCATRPFPVSADTDGLRVDLPPGGEISIINPRGSITVEVWNEQHVSVAANVKGLKPKKSPVSIKRTEQLLTVSVSPLEVGMLTRVDLTLRIPERSRTAVVSETGDVIIRGLPASLSVENVHGDIRADFPLSGDADIEAESPTKGVVSTLPLPASEVGGKSVFQARLGAGGKRVRLVSKRGRVALAAYGAPKETTPVVETVRTETARTPVSSVVTKIERVRARLRRRSQGRKKLTKATSCALIRNWSRSTSASLIAGRIAV